jgi:hypothetical protein
MTEYDDLPFSKPSDVVVETPRKCRRHDWVKHYMYDNAGAAELVRTSCSRCPAVRDETRARRGKSSRRLGHDGERRSEKRYGWAKVGEFGGITDLQGTLAIVQQKTSRREAPKAWQSIFRALEARAGGRIPLILLSFVHQGNDTEDFIVIRGKDWLAMHGTDEPGGTER